jgi:Bacteriophage HK97-gp10, putative tail-component
MPDGARLTVRRKDNLAQKLRRLAPEADQELAVANGESAQEMVGLAQGFAPVESGDLRDSIKATPPGEVPPAYAQGGKPTDTGAWLVTAGNSAVRYAHLVEFPTPAHVNGGIFAGTEHPGTEAQPFFFPAFRLVKREHKSRAARALRKSIKKVAGK